MPLITLDGAHEEGGGAILRVALALSAATGKPFRITGIRAHRMPPGLKQQHIVGIKALQDWCGAKAADCHPGSPEIMFIPGSGAKTELAIDAGTAAPVTLILQSLLPAIIVRGKRTTLRLRGGTDVAWSPPIDYCTNVLIPALRPLADITVGVQRRGYYPRGQGVVEIIVRPRAERSPLDLTARGNLLHLGGVSHASCALETTHVAERQAEAARILLQNTLSATLPHQGGYLLQIQTQYHDAASLGSGVVVWATYERYAVGADALGERDIAAEIIGESAAKALITRMDVDGIDPWLVDQLIPYLALFGGALRASEITPHARANMHVCEQFLDGKFQERDGILTFVKTTVS